MRGVAIQIQLQRGGSLQDDICKSQIDWSFVKKKRETKTTLVKMQWSKEKKKKRKRHLLKNAVVRKKLENEEDICKKIQWSTEKVENEDDICKKKNTVFLKKTGKR